MWISRDAARSDVVLVPGGIVVGAGLVALLYRIGNGIGIWPTSSIVGPILDLVVMVALMVAWPVWMARQRGEVRVTGGRHLELGELPTAALVALPAFLVAIVIAWGFQDVQLGDALAGYTAVVRVVPEGPVRLLARIALAVGTWLVLVLVARRAVEGYSSPDQPTAGMLRTWGLAAAAATVVLQLLLAVANRGSAMVALLSGLAVALTVLVVDRLLPAGIRTARWTIGAPVIVVVVLWLLRGWLFSDLLLTNLASAAPAAGFTVCIVALVEGRRPTAAALLPLVAALYLLPILPPPV